MDMICNAVENNSHDKFIYSPHVKRNQRLLMTISRQFQMNEWTFSLLLFIVSSTIVIGKIIFLFGGDIPSTFENNLSSLTDIKTYSNSLYNISKALVMIKTQNTNQYRNDTLFNSSQTDNYKSIVIETTTKISNKYGYLIRAMLSGLGILSFTWFIVYKDSNIPGINPPSPFSPSKKQIFHKSRIEMNYLIGVINGIVIFIYMSFQ